MLVCGTGEEGKTDTSNYCEVKSIGTQLFAVKHHQDECTKSPASEECQYPGKMFL